MDELDELDILIHHKMLKTANGCGKSNVTINDYRRSHVVVDRLDKGGLRLPLVWVGCGFGCSLGCCWLR